MTDKSIQKQIDEGVRVVKVYRFLTKDDGITRWNILFEDRSQWQTCDKNVAREALSNMGHLLF